MQPTTNEIRLMSQLLRDRATQLRSRFIELRIIFEELSWRSQQLGRRTGPCLCPRCRNHGGYGHAS